MQPALTKLNRIRICIALLLLVASGVAKFPVPTATDHARLSENYARLPMRFEANQGQTDSAVKFLSRGHGYGLFLTSTEAVMVLSTQLTTTETPLLSQEGLESPSGEQAGCAQKPFTARLRQWNHPRLARQR